MILPVSRVSTSASDCAFAATRSASFDRATCHAPSASWQATLRCSNARWAASTARSTSSARASGIVAHARPLPDRCWGTWRCRPRSVRRCTAGSDACTHSNAGMTSSMSARNDALLALERHAGVDPHRVLVVAERLAVLEPGDHLVGVPTTVFLRIDLGRVRIGFVASSSSVRSLDQALSDRLLVLEPRAEVVVVDADLACRLLDVGLVRADVGVAQAHDLRTWELRMVVAGVVEPLIRLSISSSPSAKRRHLHVASVGDGEVVDCRDRAPRPRSAGVAAARASAPRSSSGTTNAHRRGRSRRPTGP